MLLRLLTDSRTKLTSSIGACMKQYGIDLSDLGISHEMVIDHIFTLDSTLNSDNSD